MKRNGSKHDSFLKQLFGRQDKYENVVNTTEVVQLDTLLQYYDSFVKNHPDIIVVFSADGEIVSQNKNNFKQHLGFHPRQNVPFKELIPPNNYASLQSKFKKAIKGISERAEFTILNKQRKRLYIVGTFIPIELTRNHIEGVIIVLKDITAHKKLEQEHLLKANHLEQAQQLSNIGSFEYHILKDKIKCSNGCYTILGLKKLSHYFKDEIFSVIHSEDQSEIAQLIKRANDEGTSFSTEFRINHGITGELRYIQGQVEVIYNNGKPFKLVGVIKDNTEKRRLYTQLIEQNRSYQHIFDNLHVGIWLWDNDTNTMTFASQGLARLLKIPLKSIYEDPNFWRNTILRAYHDDRVKNYQLLGEGRSVEQYYETKIGDGTIKWVYEQSIPKLNNNGEITQVFGMVIDVNKEIEMQHKLEFLAKHDELTALPNSYSLREKIDKLIANENIHCFALVYIELDHFNWIIDFLGHEIGDLVLKKIANRLNAFSIENNYLAKVDSESFILLIANYQAKQFIFQFAENIRKTVSEQITVDGYEFYVTASIGISFYPHNGENKLVLLERAHTALYYARSLGKNNYQFYSFDRDISSHKKYMLEQDLRKAIQNEQFEMYYQPQVNPQNGVIVGAEALIRWNHEDWGLVPPNEFIPIAEEKHLIHDIGDWVIGTVCHQIKIWRETGYTLFPVSINVSPIRFLRSGIVETVKRELQRHNVPAQFIEIEITESSLLKNEENIAKTLQALKELGVKIALDDFGTQYSSFHYLQKFNLDTLKIDQLFIRNIYSDNKYDTKEAAIVSSFIHLAKGLNMKVVAEGVEDYEQMEFLKQKECDTLQGYLYSRPVPVGEFERLISKRYLHPQRIKKVVKPEVERRKYFRFPFSFPLKAKMFITEVNEQKVNMSHATILVENISLGGLRFLSMLRLPVVTTIKLNFQVEIMNEKFNFDGSLVYKSEEKADVYSYGVSFNIQDGKKDKLANIINRLTVLGRSNNEIIEANFIEEDPYQFLRNNE